MTIFKRSLLTLGLAALGFSAVFIISILAFMNSLYYELNTNALRNTAKTLMTAIGEERIAEIFSSRGNNLSQEISLPVSAAEAYRLTLINREGNVLYDSSVTDSLVNHIDRREITEALEGREASALRNSISTHNKRLYYALPVFDKGKVTGVFRLSASVPRFGIRISPVILPFVIFCLLLTITAFLAILVYSRSLSASLGRLVNIARTGKPLLSGPEAEEPVASEFRSLEKAMNAFAMELNMRIEQAKSEGSRLEAILNGMSEAVFAMDSALKLHLVNPKARELFNLGDRDVKTLSLLEATRSAELEDIAKKAISEGSPLETELTFRSGLTTSKWSGESEKCFQVYASPLSAVNSGVVLVLQEITRLIKLERVRKDFVANVSHELRTPIQLIKGFSETLLDSVSEKEIDKKQMIHFIEIISKNASVMENLTNDLLILADLENNSVNIRDMEELKILPLIEEAVSSTQPQAKRKEIKIIINCPENLNAKLFGSFLIQALINLIDNGIKYSPPKSKVDVSAKQENNEIIFEVRDEGIGIPSEHLDRIFERFYRVDRARSREAGGTGLGLSIVRHIAILHKGRVEAESRRSSGSGGEGSIFRVRIPVNPQETLE